MKHCQNRPAMSEVWASSRVGVCGPPWRNEMTISFKEHVRYLMRSPQPETLLVYILYICCDPGTRNQEALRLFSQGTKEMVPMDIQTLDMQSWQIEKRYLWEGRSFNLLQNGLTEGGKRNKTSKKMVIKQLERRGRCLNECSEHLLPGLMMMPHYCHH